MSDTRSIGVFDSGIGGLSVLRAIRLALPAEDLLYVADSKHLPYGAKAREEVIERVFAIAAFLVDRGAKALVVACNTATAAGIAELRARYALPIIGVEPAVKPAVEHTRSGVVGVLATSGTLQAEKFRRLVEQFAPQARIIIQGCPGLVERVEAGDFDGAGTQRLIREFTQSLLARGVDAIVLGCTHYPFLMRSIREVVGPEIALFETGDAVAREVSRRLGASRLLRKPSHVGTETFWTSGDPGTVAPLVTRLWGTELAVHALPSTGASARVF
jgi:glutamate racemase